MTDREISFDVNIVEHRAAPISQFGITEIVLRVPEKSYRGALEACARWGGARIRVAFSGPETLEERVARLEAQVRALGGTP